jgi:hypothetical protein
MIRLAVPVQVTEAKIPIKIPAPLSALLLLCPGFEDTSSLRAVCNQADHITPCRAVPPQQAEQARKKHICFTNRGVATLL